MDMDLKDIVNDEYTEAELKRFMYDEMAPRKRKTRSQGQQSTEPDAKKPKQEIFCICRQPNDPPRPMIQCDFCKEWYHLKCIGLKEEKIKRIKRFKCEPCKKKEELKRQQKLQQQQLRLQQLAAMQAQQANTRPMRYPCHLKGCKNLARVGSKYCKDACGQEAARQILRNIELLNRVRQNVSRKKDAEMFRKQIIKLLQNPEHEQNYLLEKHNIPNLKAEELIDVEPLTAALADHELAACVAEMEELREMYTGIELCDKNIAELEDRKAKLEAFINSVSKMEASEYETIEDEEKRTMDIVDCPACGHPVTIKRFSKHIDQCVSKVFLLF